MKKEWILLALGGALLLTGCQKKEAPPVEAAVELGTVETVVEDSGTVVYRDPYSVYATVSGKITECTFEEGDAVKAGDVLYVLDSAALEDQITQAELSLKSARQACDQAAAACADLTVTAAAGGSITVVYVHEGDFVAAGTPVAEVADRENMTLTVPFAPGETETMAPGTPATITFPSYGDAVTGAVKRVYDTPSALPGGREGVFVELTFRNPGALSGGESASAQVGAAMCMDLGQVQSGTAQKLYATQSGQVETLSMDEGVTVAAGQKIMTIENDAVTNARDNAALAQESAAVSLSQLTDKREDYVLRAAVDGTMTTRMAKTGDFAAAATPLAVLSPEDSLGVEVAVDEIYIGKVFPGQTASVSFTDDSGRERLYDAEVRRVDEAGQTLGGVTDYTVELALKDTAALKAGMNVFVSIAAERRENCLRIPTAALSGNTVQVKRNGEVVEQAVETGISGGGWTEILSGLSAGETVLY